MTFRAGKVRSAAAFPLMDMESEESRFASSGQSGNPSYDQHASPLLVKLGTSGQLRRFHAAINSRYRIRAFSAILHSITSHQYIPATVFASMSIS